MDSPRGAREAPGRQERTIWDSLGGTREVPGRQERTIWDSLGGTREVPERQENQFRATGAPSDLLKASLCYGQPAVGPTPGFAANRAVRH